ncbi:MAG TPA: hypothetical protein VHQ03_12460, partial [Candidatus Dormibacteraeota bacterium]|nr:hypothetical protein [Candidatus Dormibacteraeota bacterium]
MRTVEYAALEVPDVSNFLFGTVLTAAGVLTTAYFLGMSIVVDDETVSKRYLFGLIRVVIARKQFRAAVETEYGRGGSYQRIDFDSADEKEVMFSVYPRWVWRERDVDELYGIANQARNWRETHAQPSPPPRHHGIGTYLGSIWRMGYLLAFVFVIPVTFVYTKWGG